MLFAVFFRAFAAHVKRKQKLDDTPKKHQQPCRKQKQYERIDDCLREVIDESLCAHESRLVLRGWHLRYLHARIAGDAKSALREINQAPHRNHNKK